MRKKKNKKNGPPVFTARDIPPASFSMPEDGRKGRKLCRDRRALYLQVTSHGWKAFPSVEELADMMDWSQATTYRRLAELRELGCLPNATDSKGRKYTGRQGTRVRAVVNDALPGRGSSRWLAVTDCPTSDGKFLLIQFVNRPVEGLSNRPKDDLKDSQIEHDDLKDSQIEREKVEGLSPCVRDKRTKAFNSKEQTIQTKEELRAGWFDSFLQVMGIPSDAERESIDAMRTEYGDGVTSYAVNDWTGRPQGTAGLNHPWAVFLKESRAYLAKAVRDCRITPGLSSEELEAWRQQYVEQYGDPAKMDEPGTIGGADDYFTMTEPE